MTLGPCLTCADDVLCCAGPAVPGTKLGALSVWDDTMRCEPYCGDLVGCWASVSAAVQACRHVLLHRFTSTITIPYALRAYRLEAR